MKPNVRSVSNLLALLLVSGLVMAGSPPEADEGIRVLSWNVAEDSFVTHQAEFRALILRADADIWLLDEVAPWTDAEPGTVLPPGRVFNLDLGWQRNALPVEHSGLSTV